MSFPVLALIWLLESNEFAFLSPYGRNLITVLCDTNDLMKHGTSDVSVVE